VAAGSVGFVRHDGEIRKAGTAPSLCHAAHPCNTLRLGPAGAVLIFSGPCLVGRSGDQDRFEIEIRNVEERHRALRNRFIGAIEHIVDGQQIVSIGID
jgi:hypothetical protein